MRWSLLFLVLLNTCWLSASTRAQLPSGSSQDSSCSSVQRYIQAHSHNCYDPEQIFQGRGCSGILCSYTNFFFRLLVKECADPVLVTVEYLDPKLEFKYVFDHSETVTNGDSGNYTGVMARNASHVGFEFYVETDDNGTQIIMDPVYFPLHPARCMCESMEAVAEDFISSYSCNITNDECTELQCTVEDSVLESLTITISQCDDPPTAILQVGTNNNRTYTLHMAGSSLKMLHPTVVTVTGAFLYYTYSSDLMISIFHDVTSEKILSRHNIILDLTSCGPPRPFDLSRTEPTRPSVITSAIASPTAATVNPTPTESQADPSPTPTSSVYGTTCDAMGHIADQMNHFQSEHFMHLNCTRKHCGEIDCEGEDTTLNLSLSCSPIGMVIGKAVFNRSTKALFTESGVFADDLSATIFYTKTDRVLGFGLTTSVPAAHVPIGVPLVYYTFIPLDYCRSDASGTKPLNNAVIEAAVAVPVIFVLLLFLVTAIFTIITVHKKRRHHDYQQTPQTLNDDE